MAKRRQPQVFVRDREGGHGETHHCEINATYVKTPWQQAACGVGVRSAVCEGNFVFQFDAEYTIKILLEISKLPSYTPLILFSGDGRQVLLQCCWQPDWLSCLVGWSLLRTFAKVVQRKMNTLISVLFFSVEAAVHAFGMLPPSALRPRLLGQYL